MANPFLGQIILFAGNYAPVGWAICDGSLQSIGNNEALFTVLGTTYGGDGQTTFALPDLRGRAPVHAGGGPGPGLSAYVNGQVGGSETVTLTAAQLPAHTHAVTISANNENATQSRPGGNILGSFAMYDAPASADTTLGGVTSTGTGGNAPHENRQPFLVCNYIIATEGIFPSQS